MIQRLSIKNYILIEDLQLNFHKGLTTVTGETGAGKSIILGAISLLTGNRADKGMIRNPEKKCIIEAEFNLKGLNLQQLFERNDFDYFDECIIRREFNKDGKSRVFINDTPALLNSLKQIVNQLLDVHSQHENLELNKKQYQLDVLDAFAAIKNEVSDYQNAFNTYKEAENELNDLIARSHFMRENSDFLNHQLNELIDADLQAGEQEELESQLDVLNHAEEVKLNLSGIDGLLSESEQNPIDVLKEVHGLLRRTKSFMKSLDECDSRLESAIIELEDIARDLSRISEGAVYDPEKISMIQDRLDLIYKLQQKHRVSTIEELIAIKEKFDTELQSISSLDEHIEAAQQKHDESLEIAKNLAEEIHKYRTIASTKFKDEVHQLLQTLGMKEAQFDIQIERQETLSLNAYDQVEFLFSANKGMGLKAIGKIASGGELSRLMLSIKAILARKTVLPTVIFDEIDTGISGEIAEKMGRVIRQLSSSTQVLAITHLPQIAAQGEHHFKVLKEHGEQDTITTMNELDEQNRLEEVARLLSGEEISEEAMNNAKVMLATSQES